MNVVKGLDKHLEEYILIILSILTVAIIFLQVVMRYVFGNSLPWSEELARYLFIWMIYIGVSYGVKRRKHLNVDSFSMLFEQKGKIVVGIISNSLFLVFAVVIAVYGINIIADITRESAALEIPMGWIYAAPTAGMLLTIIRLLQVLTIQVRELKTTQPDENPDV